MGAEKASKPNTLTFNILRYLRWVNFTYPKPDKPLIFSYLNFIHLNNFYC